MLKMIPIKCPRCKKMAEALSFLKRVDDKYFHICSSCIGNPLSEDDALIVGFHHGYQKAKEDFKEFLNKLN